MANRLRWMLAMAAGLAVACGDKGDEDEDEDDAGGDDTAAADDTASTDDSGGGGGFPPDPRPVSVTVSGAYSGTLVFDEVNCTHPLGSSNLRVFYRGSGHVFVLKAEILGDFSGVGTYSSADTRTQSSLQEEAGGSGYYFAADASQGDSVQIDIEGFDEEAGQAWGAFTVSGMHDTTAGTITLSPSELPIWCPTLD
jgi:hypothetical protein